MKPSQKLLYARPFNQTFCTPRLPNAPERGSWWLEPASWEDFRARAQAEADRMRQARGAVLVDGISFEGPATWRSSRRR